MSMTWMEFYLSCAINWRNILNKSMKYEWHVQRYKPFYNKYFMQNHSSISINQLYLCFYSFFFALLLFFRNEFKNELNAFEIDIPVLSYFLYWCIEIFTDYDTQSECFSLFCNLNSFLVNILDMHFLWSISVSIQNE